MLNNAVHGYPHAPSSRLEYESLRIAGGDGPGENPGDGSRPDQVRNGIIRRYGWAPRIFAPTISTNFNDDVWPLMTPGTGFVITGRMVATNNHFRRWDPDFMGAHSVYGQRETTADRIWLQNPLAPSTYPGEWMTRAQLGTYWSSFRNWILFGTIGALKVPDTATEDPDVRIVTVTIREMPVRKFTTKSAELRRFTATEELSPIPGPYSSAVDATVSIQGNPGVPHGLGFLRLAAGGSEGKYILASEVTLS
jgi:hypothetical protein